MWLLLRYLMLGTGSEGTFPLRMASPSRIIHDDDYFGRLYSLFRVEPPEISNVSEAISSTAKFSLLIQLSGRTVLYQRKQYLKRFWRSVRRIFFVFRGGAIETTKSLRMCPIGRTVVTSKRHLAPPLHVSVCFLSRYRSGLSCLSK